ncbi:MAG: cupin domain-containing protein [SAR86 cluster bacterium]
MPDSVMTGPLEGQKLVHATAGTAPSIPGRRSFLEYRDLGVTEGSNGALRAQIMKTKQGLSEPTGWHYHVCEGQFIYVLKGWVDLEFETGDQKRITQGDSMYIPGGMRHSETATSQELEILELSLPSDMGTVPTDAPEGMKT